MNSKLKITIFYGAAVLFIWTADAVIDAFLFHQGSISETLFSNVSSQELSIRSLIISSVIMYAAVVSRVARKRERARAALEESEEALQTLSESLKDAVVVMDHWGNIFSWNPAAERMFGYAAGEVVGRELHTLLVPGRCREAYREGFSRSQETGEGAIVGAMELTAVRKGGMEFPVELTLSFLKNKGKCRAIGILRDFSARKKHEKESRHRREQLENLIKEQTEDLQPPSEFLDDETLGRRLTEELCRSGSFLNALFNSFHDPLSVVDRDFRITKFNDAFALMRNKSARDFYGKKCYEVLHNRDAVCKDCVVEKTFRSTDPCATKKSLALPDGSEVWLEIYTYPILDRHQNVSHVIEYARDVTDQEKAEKEKKQLIKRLSHLSTTDCLTGLLNRRALYDVLHHELERADRYNSELSVILCDVDWLKKINDTYGHAAGDQALQAVSETLRKSLRQADIVGRYGGDEFMIILPETPHEGAERLAEKMRAAVEKIDIKVPGHHRVTLSISVGVAGLRAFDETIDAFLARADAALYTSKIVGRNKVSVSNK